MSLLTSEKNVGLSFIPRLFESKFAKYETITFWTPILEKNLMPNEKLICCISYEKKGNFCAYDAW